MENEKLYLAETITDYIRDQCSWMTDRDMRTLGHLRRDVVCVNSPIGEYQCYAKIRFSAQSELNPICVDTCLQHEIHELFYCGVNTIGCCCGHGVKQAYIQVSPQSVKKMHELGYTQLEEDEHGNGKWCFRPKTYFPEPINTDYKLNNG